MEVCGSGKWSIKELIVIETVTPPFGRQSVKLLGIEAHSGAGNER